MTSNDLAGLTKRARHIRQLYTRQAEIRGGRAWTPSEVAQGFVGDVGDLMKLVMAKEGLRPAKDLGPALAHELADCLWSVLVLADAYEVDLERAFTTTMSDLERKLRPARRTKTARKSRARQG